MQRIRLRYAKRGPLRFTSHRDFARAFERALRRAAVPIAYSQGFTPHPKISYASAAPDRRRQRGGIPGDRPAGRGRPGAAAGSRWTPRCRPAWTCSTPWWPARGSLADRIDASRWRIELPAVEPAVAAAAVAAFLAADEVLVERMTKQGRRSFDARVAVTLLRCDASSLTHLPGRTAAPCAIIDLVVRQVTPAVRPDDVLSGLRVVAGLEPPVPPRVTRLAQGTLTAQGEIVDPLDADREDATIGGR